MRIDKEYTWQKSELKKESFSKKSKQAYRIYSIFYPILALLAYKIIWRGRLFKHIKFFNQSLKISRHVVDIATGDGTLTKKALFPISGMQAKKLLALDISEAMLAKAVRKLPKDKTRLIHGDAQRLPFSDLSQKLLTCFGGFNSFTSPTAVMQEFARVLSKNGNIRGSVLFTPNTPKRRRAIDLFIRWGLQTMHVDKNKFLNWIQESGLKLTKTEQYGDVYLFEATKK